VKTGEGNGIGMEEDDSGLHNCKEMVLPFILLGSNGKMPDLCDKMGKMTKRDVYI
jgi:hypothetical protein